MEIRSRHHLRSDEADEIVSAVEEALGVDLGERELEAAELDDGPDLYLVDGEPLVARYDGEPFLTVRGALATEPERRRVTVDAGAVEFVTNGADVMRPGIEDVDDGIEEGDLVVIREVSHGKPLAIGRALEDGDAMLGDEGKVVESLHHVDDELWALEV